MPNAPQAGDARVRACVDALRRLADAGRALRAVTAAGAKWPEAGQLEQLLRTQRVALDRAKEAWEAVPSPLRAGLKGPDALAEPREELAVGIGICRYCGVSNADRRDGLGGGAACPRCGKRPPGPGEAGPSPLLLTALLLLGLGLVIPLDTGADTVGLVLGGALAAAGIALAGAAALRR
jgi:hypothetical protein